MCLGTNKIVTREKRQEEKMNLKYRGRIVRDYLRAKFKNRDSVDDSAVKRRDEIGQKIVDLTADFLFTFTISIDPRNDDEALFALLVTLGIIC